MATNFIQPGDVLELTAPSGGVVSGTPYLIGTVLVIALTTAAQTLPFRGKVTGVFYVVKNSAEAWTEGAKVYWDNTAKKFTTTSTSNTLVGVAVAAAANPSSNGYVRLDGITR
jgi:predicted RecA/RadA family phage recombinase